MSAGLHTCGAGQRCAAKKQNWLTRQNPAVTAKRDCNDWHDRQFGTEQRLQDSRRDDLAFPAGDCCSLRAGMEPTSGAVGDALRFQRPSEWVDVAGRMPGVLRSLCDAYVCNGDVGIVANSPA